LSNGEGFEGESGDTKPKSLSAEDTVLYPVLSNHPFENRVHPPWQQSGRGFLGRRRENLKDGQKVGNFSIRGSPRYPFCWDPTRRERKRGLCREGTLGFTKKERAFLTGRKI